PVSMIEDDRPQDMARIEIPGAALARGAERVFVKARTVATAAARIPFREVGANRSDRIIELGRESPRALISRKSRRIEPSYIRKEKRVAIRRHSPERVLADARRHLLMPFGKAHRV